MSGIFDYEEQHVIEADRFNQQAWSDVSAGSNAVKSLVTNGKIDVGDRFEPLVDDVFQSLYQYSPTTLDPVDQKLTGNKLLIDQLQESNEYQNLRVDSYLDQDMSAIGTLYLADNLREQVKNNPELKKTLDELNGEGEEDKSGKGKGQQPGEGEGDEDSDEEGEGKPGKKQSKKQVKQPTEEQIKVVRRAVEKAAKQAGEKLGDAQSVISSYGLEEGELKKGANLDERKQLIDRLLNNRKLKELADKIGRLDRIISSQKLTRTQHVPEEFVDVTLSNDLAHLTPREFVMMDEAPEDFARRFVNKELITYELEGQESTGKGPIVVLIDKSGSMSGENDNWSTAITFSLMMQAKKENRDFFFAAFTTRIIYSKKFESGKYTLQELMEVVDITANGGTDFQQPLQFAMDACKEDEKLRTADVVFVTDGDANITDEWLKRVNEQKKVQEINIFTILVSGYGNIDAETHALKPISNEIYNIEKIIDGDNINAAASSLVHATSV